MKIDIIIAYILHYQRGHEVDFVPPITGIHLAAITPARHRVSGNLPLDAGGLKAYKEVIDERSPQTITSNVQR